MATGKNNTWLKPCNYISKHPYSNVYLQEKVLCGIIPRYNLFMQAV